MIDVKTAEELVKRYCIKLKTELVHLSDLGGRVLSSPIKSARVQPPFNRVAMDGIAIRYKDRNLKSFELKGIQKAGSPPLTINSEKVAIEIMTGAPLPKGFDTVVPYERIQIENGIAKLEEAYPIEEKQNIHFEGSDYSEDKILLEKGLRLNSAAIAIIASQGLEKAEVYKLPKIAIISTGDELIEPGKACEPWQIWKSNVFAIQSELKSFGVPEKNITLFHLEDKREEVFENLKKILNEYDGLIISGGVSMGKYDFVQAVMNDLGVEQIFYKITQKPGKPMFFGKGQNSQAVFALPGNPVSALVCMRRYVIPSLESSLKSQAKVNYVQLTEDISFKKEFSFFKAVKIHSNKNAELLATPISSNGSGDFSSLGGSDGFIELPAEDPIHKAGDSFKFFPWKGGVL